MHRKHLNVLVIFLMSSMIWADFFDDYQLLHSDLSWRDSLPKNMPIIKKPFWSENGVFRKYNIAPDNRLDELKLRKDMMQWHQKLALINLGLIGYQYYIGSKLDEGNLSNSKYNEYKSIHKNLGYSTFTIYMSSAGLSIFSPPALKYDKGLSSMKLHRYLAIIHFAGMSIQPWLGYQTSKGGEDYSEYIDIHRQTGEIVLGAYLVSFLLTLLPE